LSETTFAWQDASLSPRERAKKLVEAMTLEQMIAQLHGAMETIDIYALSAQAAESGADMDQLVGFEKVFVEPGESKLVTITIDPAATNHPFSVWDYCTRIS
jgi:hypothetical protein